MNFTSQYLFRLKRRILDNSGNPIDTISYSDEKANCIYIPPSLDYNIITLQRQTKKAVLRESRDVSELKEFGLSICSIPAENVKKYYKGQKDFYYLVKTGQVPIGAIIINKIDGGHKRGQHYLLFDDANQLVKLIGPNAGPLGEGQWIQLEKH